MRASGEDGDWGPRGAGGGLWEETGRKEFLMYSGPPLSRRVPDTGQRRPLQVPRLLLTYDKGPFIRDAQQSLIMNQNGRNRRQGREGSLQAPPRPALTLLTTLR